VNLSVKKIFANFFFMKKLFLGLLLFIGFMAFASVSFAEQNIQVTPQLTQIDLANDAPEAIIYYTNNTSSALELKLSVHDVAELEERNPVGFLDPKNAQNYKYSLSSWVYLDKQTLLLAPGEKRQVKASITKEKLSPGGHYGSILAEIVQTTEKKKVQVKAILASLLFVRAHTGFEIEEAKIAFFGLEQNFFQFPKKAIFRFQNTGNVDLAPYGTVEITDSNNKVVGKGIVNEDSLITLPESIRKYTLAIKPLQSFISPGTYTAVIKLRYGKANKTIETKTQIFTEGSIDIKITIAGLIALLVAGSIIARRVRKKKKN